VLEPIGDVAMIFSGESHSIFCYRHDPINLEGYFSSTCFQIFIC